MITATPRADALPADAARLWKPNEGPQTELLRRIEFEVGYGGAKGGGKSDGLVWGATRQIHHPAYQAVIFRRSYPDLQELMDRSQRFVKLEGRWNEQKKRWTFPGGARIRFGYCDDPGDEDAYLGQEFQYLGFDQAEQLSELQYTKLISCARTSYEGLRVMVRASFNPGGEGHAHMKRRFWDLGALRPIQDAETGLSRVYIPARVWDNPVLLRNDPAYVQRLMAISDPALRRAYLEGDMRVFAGMYFSEWRDDLHVVEVHEQFEIPDYWGRSAGMDWGFDPHPGIVLWNAYDLHQRAWCYKELLFHQSSPLEVARMIEEKTTDEAERTMLIRADTQMWEKEPAKKRGESIATEINRELHRKGLKVTLIPAKKDRMNGWARTHQYLDPRRPRPDGEGHGPYLRFFRANPHTGLGCQYAIDTIPAQIHDDTEGKEWDLKKSPTDHAADAERYELMDRPPLSLLPVALEPGRSHHRAVHDRVKQRILEAIEQVQQQEQEGELPVTAGRFPVTTEGGNDADLVGDVYG